MKWFSRGSSLPVKWFWKLWNYPWEMIFGGLKVADFEGLEVPKWNMRPKWFWNIRTLYMRMVQKKRFWEMIFGYLLPPKPFTKVGVMFNGLCSQLWGGLWFAECGCNNNHHQDNHNNKNNNSRTNRQQGHKLGAPAHRRRGEAQQK